MRIEQGVKIDDGTDDDVVAIVPNEYSIRGPVNNNYAICCFKPDNPFKVVGYVLADLQLAIKIAKMLNEDLKRGDV